MPDTLVLTCQAPYLGTHIDCVVNNANRTLGYIRKNIKCQNTDVRESAYNTLVRGDPRGRVVKVADFSALDHSIISPMWVRASLGARVPCGTSQVLLAVVSGGFSPGTPVFAPPTD